MFINPRTAIDEGWITGTDDFEKYIQPNAIDFPINRLFEVSERSPFIVCEENKTHRITHELHPLYINLQEDENKHSLRAVRPFAYKDANVRTSFWGLEPHKCYDILSDFFVKVPEGVAVEIIGRSTFIRNGIFLTSGLYDSGFQGHIGCVLHNRSGEAYVAKGTRVGQVKFYEADSHGKYAGGYNHGEGTGWK